MRINYDFSDLEAFLAVKETGSFHAAAERLNLSQSAVTRRVQKLEEVLDSVLFERTTRAVKPTLAAKRLQARAEAMLEEAQETLHAMRDESMAFEYQRGAVITVAAISTVIAKVIGPAIRTFRDQGFTQRIRLIDGAANDVAEAVTAGDADFGLCSIPTIEPSTVFEPLFDEPIVLALPLGHPLAEKPSLKWTDLAEVSLILPARGTGNRLLIDDAMARARRPLTWTYEVRRSTTALDLVRDNHGAALLPQSAVQAEDIAMCQIRAPQIDRPVGLLTRVGQKDRRAVVALKDAVRAAV